jgi:hypothetical protein
MRLRVLSLIILAVATASAGCGDDTPTSPSSPTDTTPVTVTERFDAIVDVKGLNSYNFSVSRSGAATTVNLASLAPLDRPGLVDVNMQIGIGTTVLDDAQNVIGCELRKTIDTRPGLTAQLSDTLTAATNYCATIADIGNLKESVNFSIRVSHP